MNGADSSGLTAWIPNNYTLVIYKNVSVWKGLSFTSEKGREEGPDRSPQFPAQSIGPCDKVSPGIPCPGEASQTFPTQMLCPPNVTQTLEPWCYIKILAGSYWQRVGVSVEASNPSGHQESVGPRAKSVTERLQLARGYPLPQEADGLPSLRSLQRPGSGPGA